MSKASKREARQKKELSEQERRAEFLRILQDYLLAFAQYYRQEAPGEEAVALYDLGLCHLRPDQLRTAMQEAIKKHKFFPSVSEILETYQEWLNRQPQVGGYNFRGVEGEHPPTPEQKAELDRIWKESWEEINRGFSPSRRRP